MSAYSDIKDEFFREQVREGFSEPPDKFRQAVPPKILSRWQRQFSDPIEVEIGKPQRLVNHFLVGADPEFCVTDNAGNRTNANDLYLRAALAWGADNNGRLVEIRPKPSRYALEVAASVWATLHWMSVIHPLTLEFLWRSGSFYANDGLGGHIHFGRKRPTTPQEVSALDTLAYYLTQTNIFSAAEARERIRRTRGHGNYGALGDKRFQSYGYEYRVFPSWLDSPWLAYFVLVAAKLAVFDPSLMPALTPTIDGFGSVTLRRRLKNLLAYYKGRDDDAALAYDILCRYNFPQADPTDFKARWGIFTSPTIKPKSPGYFVPAMISPSPEAIREFGESLIRNHPPEWTEAEPNWEPKKLPPNYLAILERVSTYHRPGWGELTRGIVSYTGWNLDWVQGEKYVIIPRSWAPRLDMRAIMATGAKNRWDIQVRDDKSSSGGPMLMSGDFGMESETRQKAQEFLVSGLFPFWRATEVRPESFDTWYKAHPVRAEVKTSKPRPPASKLLSAQPTDKAAKQQVANPLIPWPGRIGTWGRSFEQWAVTAQLGLESMTVIAMAPGTVYYNRETHGIEVRNDDQILLGQGDCPWAAVRVLEAHETNTLWRARLQVAAPQVDVDPDGLRVEPRLITEEFPDIEPPDNH